MLLIENHVNIKSKILELVIYLYIFYEHDSPKSYNTTVYLSISLSVSFPISISLASAPPLSILIIGEWCYVPVAEARGSLGSIPSGIRCYCYPLT